MNRWLIAGGVLSAIAAGLHIAVIFGGPDWYRAFGAGERLATLAEQGSVYPTVVTLAIAAVLFVWALFAFSGAGLIRKLPLLRTALVIISAIYLLRGIAPFLAMPFVPEFVSLFWVWSSLVCTVYGVAYGIGTYRAVRELRNA